MATPVKQEHLPHQTYMPINPGASHIQSLNEKIATLSKAIFKADCALEQADKQTIFELIGHRNELAAELARCINERNACAERVVQLKQSLENSIGLSERVNSNAIHVIGFGGLGFGLGAFVACLNCFSREQALLTAAAGTLTGAITGHFLTPKTNSKKEKYA